MLTCYIACSYLDRNLYDWIAAEATKLGFSITYRWPDYDPPAGGAERHAHRKEQAKAEHEGIEMADVLIVGLPGRYGTATEIGIAIANEIPVVLFGSLERDEVTGDPVNIFLDHPCVGHVSTSPKDLRGDLREIGTKILADKMDDLIRAQLNAPYDSWTTSGHRAELARVSEAYNKLHGLEAE